MLRRRRLVVTLAISLALHASHVLAGERIAAFPAELLTSGLEPVSDDELARLQMLDRQLGAALADQGYTLVDSSPVADEIGQYASLWNCNGCELGLARQLDADLAAVLWVQKVSNLILNINLKISDAVGREIVRAGSVDIRGNTDESWTRGLRYLLENRIFKP